MIIKNRIELLKYIPTNGICAEIGVHRGKYSNKILEICQPKELYLIDGWETIDHLPPDTNGEKCDYKNKEYWLSIHNQIIEEFNGKANICCGNNLMASYPKVKQYGYIAGHDMTPIFIGVINAVLDFVSLNNVSVIGVTDDAFSSYLLKKRL